MQLINRLSTGQTLLLPMLCLLGFSMSAVALESDRQQPLEINANATDGTLGDGITTMRGDVEIRQGTLHITADEAEVKKADGRVQSVTFRGRPAYLEQEIEEQGLVKATAGTIDYQVATGIVTLTGDADVQHPQYQISGDVLTYDLEAQHFEGSGAEDGNSRIHIRLDPEVINKADKKDATNPARQDSDKENSGKNNSDGEDS